jgi:hypothetical protein
MFVSNNIFADYSKTDSYKLIHIFKPIHTHIDKPVQAYINRLIQSNIDTHTYLALKIHFVLTFFAYYIRLHSYTLIHIFKSIHTVHT